MRFAPVWSLVYRQADRIRRLHEVNDDLRHELAVQKARAARWRRTAMELAPKVGPKALHVCLMQVQSDEIADLPESKEHQ